MTNVSTQQLAQLLLGVARAQNALVEALENSKAGFKATHSVPQSKRRPAYARIVRRHFPTTHRACCCKCSDARPLTGTAFYANWRNCWSNQRQT